MYAHFGFSMVQQVAEEQAFLDNGASENLIDDETWKTTQYCWLEVKRGNQEYKMWSFTIRLRKDCLILEYPIALTFNLQEDWWKG